MRKTMWFVIACAACSCGGPIAEEAAVSEPAGARALGKLETRDSVITYYSTIGGARFTVRGRDGSLVAANVTFDELRARRPDLGELVETSVARPIDATLTMPRATD